MADHFNCAPMPCSMRWFVIVMLAVVGLKAEAETHTFQTEVSRLLDIIINSLYSQKDVFIREAISNASDALDKIRFLGVQDSKQLDVEPELSVRISIDRDAETLTIEDTGIGMTKADLINNLGTIARSGTTQFLEAIARSGSMNLIGQFGVGFYSYYLVAAEVTVASKHYDDDQHVWRSSAGATFTIERDEQGPFLKRGTRVTLKLKKDAREFLEPRRLRELVTRYSEFTNFPIYLHVSKEVEREVEEVTETQAPPAQEGLEVTEEKPAAPAKKKVKETVWEWEQLNQNKPLWLRPPEEVKADEYKQFHRVISKNSYEDPLSWVHFRAEGEVEFTALLYIPKKMPRSFTEQDEEKGAKSNVRLYIRRVLVGDDFRELLPRYLGFVEGVVDSDDLPINVSRESLQQLRAIRTIKKKLVRKVLDRLDRLAGLKDEEKKKEGELTEEEKAAHEAKKASRRTRYEEFWAEYGKTIKLGVVDDSTNRDRLAGLLLYKSSFNETNTLTSLADYKSRMQANQTDIYFMGGDDAKQLLQSPMVKAMTRRNYEVLLMDQPIDEYATQVLGKFNDLKLVNIAKSGFTLPQSEEEKVRDRKLKKVYETLLKYLKKTLPDVSKITVNANIAPEPLVVLASEAGYSAHLEKIARAQAVTHNADRMEMFNIIKRNVEVNPFHPFIKQMLDRLAEGETPETEQLALALYETGLINSGYVLKEPTKFAGRVYRLLSTAFGTPADLESVEIDLSEVVDPETEKKAQSSDGTKEEQETPKADDEPVEFSLPPHMGEGETLPDDSPEDLISNDL